ncbi:HEAT repeat-containing protein [Biscogniauxia sp. FL1348]|nr:HEAT repeat-containing protein [Biscogniauxia sp. FL1348]
MAEKLSDDQVATLLAILRKDVSVDAKIQHVNIVKSGIKQHNVPDTCVAPLFEALRLASSSHNSALVNAGFTALNHLLTRLSRQDPKYLVREAKHTLPVLVDKMGDPKDKFRGVAIQAMATMYVHAPMDTERFVRNTAMVGKNPRAKEAGMQWLLQMHNEHGLQFRAYVPTLMELLEDADGMVRDAAKATVLELFRDAPNAAKSDLKRQLKNFKVRPAIEQAIVKELGPTTRADADSRPGSALQMRPPSAMQTRPASAMQTRPNLAASVSSLGSERPITPMPDASAEAVEPSYVNTQRELDDMFRDMHPWFEGKETEQNWLKREESMTKLRRLIAGNAASDFPDAFIAGCRSLLDGIIKAVNSLRTSLSKEGCAFVQDLANAFGPGMDPMVELLMQTFIKLSAATKKMSSQLANITVDIIIGRATYTVRIMQHIWGACQDKNVQPRTYATGWLKTLLKKEAHHKNHLEHGGGADLIEKCIKKGLNDPNPGVREKMRSTYWAFAVIFPARAEAIMDALDGTAQKLLQKDPNNPNASEPKKSEPAPRPGMGLSKSTMTASKPSLREAMLAQKKAMSTRTLPTRPGSAMASISPARTNPHASSTSATPAGTTSATRTRPESSAKPHGGMSVAPMRPARRRPEAPARPEIAARPATAGPYSVRSHDAPATERSSPDHAKAKATTPKAVPVSPRRTVPKTRPGHASIHSESSIPTPSKSATSKTLASPRASPISPARSRTMLGGSVSSSSPSRGNEDFSLVVPSVSNLRESLQFASPTASPRTSQVPLVQLQESPMPPPPGSNTGTPSKTVKVYEDPLTEEQKTPQPTSSGVIERPVLEDRPVNEDAANLTRTPTRPDDMSSSPAFSDKSRQNSRLLDSGIARVKAQTLDVHGFRKLQSLIRDNKAPFSDEKFDALLLGLFHYLESPLSNLVPERVQDVKAQILATIKLLLKKARDNFQPHVSRGIEALLNTRACYDARTHIVSGLELLADELVSIGDADEITVTLTRGLGKMDTAADTSGYHRSMSMGLHVLKQLMDTKPTFVPNDSEIAGLTDLAAKCLESRESGVRMDAVQLCVALHARLGDAHFWECMKGVKDDPKSLITYYVVKRQREAGGNTAPVS